MESSAKDGSKGQGVAAASAEARGRGYGAFSPGFAPPLDAVVAAAASTALAAVKAESSPIFLHPRM